MNYVRNNEFFNEIVDGYTFFGYYINPKIAFKPKNNILIEAGGFLRKEFGSKGFQEIEPTFTIKFRRKNYDIIFGNLEGNLSHLLIEPLMNFENLIKKPLEHGIQIKKVRNKTAENLDIWLDWQRSTLAGKDQQEEILFGLNCQSNPIDLKTLKVSFPIQLTAFHRGGQNLAVNLPVKTYINSAIGINLKHRFEKSALFFENYFVGGFEGKNQGSGYYSNLKLQTKNLQIILSFWSGTNYNSVIGGDLFQSFSRKFGNENYIEKKRSFLIFRLIRDWSIIENLNLSFRFEPTYDFRNKKFEHSEGLYLKYDLN